MTKEEIKNAELLPYSEERLIFFDELYLVPTKRKHNSGYNIIEVVGYNIEKDKLVKLTDMSDVIDINCKWFLESEPTYGVKIDMDPSNGLFCLSNECGKQFQIVSRMSSFAVKVVNKMENKLPFTKEQIDELVFNKESEDKMIKTGYEIIGMIKDGKAPKKIRTEKGFIYNWNEWETSYEDGLCYLPIITRLNDEFEIIEEPKVWKPKEGEEFYYLDLYGAIVRGIVESGSKEFVECLYVSGNIFKTYDEAEKALEKLKIYMQLKRFAEEHNTEKIDWNNTNKYKWYINCHFDKKYIDIDGDLYFKNINQVYFTSQELCKQAIEEIGEDNIKKLFEE